MSKAATDTLDKVSDQFEGEVLADLQEGRGQALALVQAARREAAEVVSKTLETGVRQAEALKRQIIGAAELEIRNAQLRALEGAVSEVFNAAVEKVSNDSGASHTEALARLIKEGVDVIGPKAKVACNSRDRKEVASLMRKGVSGLGRLTLDPESIDTIGGVVLTSSDGSIRFDNTFEARLERMKPSLRKEVASILTTS